MKRHEMWRKAYRERRYMEHLTPAELRQRFCDVHLNTLTVSPEGKMGIKTFESLNGEFWLIQMTELQEEYSLRGGMSPWLLDDTPFPLLYRDQHPGAKAAEGRDFPPFYFAKFGSAQNLKRTLDRGEVFIRPASGFSDPSLSPAIRDEELKLDISIWPGDFPEGDPRREGPGYHLVRLGSGTDYYAYCLSMVYDYRLFDDFQADACLLIRRPNEFSIAIIDAVAQKLPGWLFAPGPVHYVDPLNTHQVQAEVFFLKHFRYAYQQEVRLVWIPPEPKQIGTLEPLILEAGPLNDFCELIELPQTYEKRLETASWRPPKAPPPYEDTATSGIDSLSAGAATDALVFEHLMKTEPPDRCPWDRSTNELLPFTLDQSASHAVLSRLMSYGWGYMRDIEDRELMHRGGFRVRFMRDSQIAEAEAGSLELAICRAALKAGRIDGLVPPGAGDDYSESADG